MSDMKKIKDTLIKSGAAVFALDSTTGKFCISLDSSVLTEDFKTRTLFKDALIELMYDNGLSPDVLVGMDNAGIVFTSLMASSLGVPMAYVRSAAKDHGKKNRIEGLIQAGDRAVVFVDAVYTDKEVDGILKALDSTGCTVDGILTIFSCVENDMVLPLVTYDSLLRRAVKKKYVSQLFVDFMEDCEPAKDLDSIMAENAAEILLDIKAVALSPDKPFTFASGIISPIYCDNRLLISHHDQWMIIINYMMNIINDKIGAENFDIVCGTATAGIPHGALLADILKKPFIWVKDNVSQPIPEGSRVLIIEDLISTGKSSAAAVDAVREAGGVVSDVISIFTYGMKKADDIFAAKECMTYSVSNFDALIAVASEKKYIKKKDIDKICEWIVNPEKWGKKYGFEK